ncbi:Os05g0108350 [Oryza sativa Japonica Group]|uniref:Os05g0108350 protein n=1 Tax=Oryza sativa subsp. japonica TaxID=39947 RepID=A0A0P0WGZ1_ORYSJ|nr:hypothetical protein EE612_026593 [Oryza sativa]BAS91896.1 Os05g0108350 [Oryza sativa Japonica Group]
MLIIKRLRTGADRSYSRFPVNHRWVWQVHRSAKIADCVISVILLQYPIRHITTNMWFDCGVRHFNVSSGRVRPILMSGGKVFLDKTIMCSIRLITQLRSFIICF